MNNNIRPNMWELPPAVFVVHVHVLYKLIVRYRYSCVGTSFLDLFMITHAITMFMFVLPYHGFTLSTVGLWQAKQVHCFSRYQFHVSLEHNCTHKTVTMHTCCVLAFTIITIVKCFIACFQYVYCPPPHTKDHYPIPWWTSGAWCGKRDHP